MSHPRVQVIVRSCDRREFLRQALDALVAQTATDFHVLVVDDGSTDGAGDLAVQYQRTVLPRMTVVRNPKRIGAHGSLRLALERSRGYELLALLDDDDLWEPTKLERQVAVMDVQPRVGIVATEARVIDVRGHPTGELFSDLYGLPADPCDTARRIFEHENFLCASSVLIRSRLLEVADFGVPLKTSANTDAYLWLIAGAQAETYWIDAPLTSYRVTPGSATATRHSKMRRDSFALREYAYANFACVRTAVGGAQARRKLDGDTLWWAHALLADRDIVQYLWFAWRVIRRGSVRLWLHLAYLSVRALVRPQALPRFTQPGSGPHAD